MSSKSTFNISGLFLLFLIVTLSSWSTYVWNNNVYMKFQDVPVTFIDKYTVQACSKHSCTARLEGLFKTESGYVFDREISGYMYRQMHLGEKLTLNLRQFDIKQTPRDNLYWFFGPLLVYGLTIVVWLQLIICFWEQFKKRKGK